jgi:acetyl esterase
LPELEALDPEILPLIEPAPPVRDVAVLRADQEARTAELGGEPVAMAAVRERDDAPVRVREYVPEGDVTGAVVYLHGGGWATGSVDTVDRAVRRLARAAGARVLSVGYRLAPEHPFPAGLEDAEAALGWALEGGFGPVAVAGDSAGGNLATVAARRTRLPLRLQALLYPVCDAALETASYADFAEGYRLSRDEMAWFFSLYGGDGEDPDVSPLRAPLDALRDLPPAYVLTASHDVLRDEAEAYAERLREAGVPVEVDRRPGVIHGFLRWPGVVGAARTALDEIGSRLGAALRG